MLINQKQFTQLNKLVNFHVMDQLDTKQADVLCKNISTYLNDPEIDPYKLQVLVLKLMHLGADFESFVSAYIFKFMPDNFTRKELILLEEELFLFVEKKLFGLGLDKQVTENLIKITEKNNPQITTEQAKKKAIGNWGWLIPHVLFYVIVERILKMIQVATLENKKKHRKGRIRIKKF